jgi:branched-subunit amino acid aminotransferase/4-amino-4-deoxychorismate lyase
MTENWSFTTQINGRSATADDLSPLAFAGFAHFTAMQVRDGRVKGLDLHLSRLRSQSMEFFGNALPDDQVRSYLRTAIENGPAEISLTVTMFSRNGEFTPSGNEDDPAVLVRTGPASSGPIGPLRLAAVEHQRPLPKIKHVGEADLAPLT